MLCLCVCVRVCVCVLVSVSIIVFEYAFVFMCVHGFCVYMCVRLRNTPGLACLSAVSTSIDTRMITIAVNHALSIEIFKVVLNQMKR